MEAAMKYGRVLVSVILFAGLFRYATTQVPDTNKSLPKYDLASEVTLKGTITDISERNCPVSGGLGFHFILKIQDGTTIEVHVATSKFVKSYEIGLKKDDKVEVVGSKVKFEGADTIFARQITRGDEVFVVRFQDGSPAW
jgi:DNA/RNA endonuclease YhcR with UshA esterase domain